MKLVFRCLTLAALCLLLVECSTIGFYSQAIGGQLRLMHQRQAIQKLLVSNDTDPALKGQLQQVSRIMQFASESLALPGNGSYTRYVETGREAVVWNVVATPADSLEAITWCFPVAGCVPYRGYFKRDKAQAFADKLAGKGLDVALLPATAYSTLGWFEDPVLDTMLAYPEYRLAELLFHELAHQLLYVKGDAEFNESFATLVARDGVDRWLARRNDPAQTSEWRRYRSAQDHFNRLLTDTRDELARLYANPPPGDSLTAEKEVLIDSLRERYQEQVSAEGRGDGYATWLRQPLNNAHFALHATYENGVAAFRCLLSRHPDDPGSFYRAAADIGRESAEQRRAWLSQSPNTHCESS